MDGGELAKSVRSFENGRRDGVVEQGFRTTGSSIRFVGSFTCFVLFGGMLPLAIWHASSPVLELPGGQ